MITTCLRKLSLCFGETADNFWAQFLPLKYLRSSEMMVPVVSMSYCFSSGRDYTYLVLLRQSHVLAPTPTDGHCAIEVRLEEPAANARWYDLWVAAVELWVCVLGRETKGVSIGEGIF